MLPLVDGGWQICQRDCSAVTFAAVKAAVELRAEACVVSQGQMRLVLKARERFRPGDCTAECFVTNSFQA